MSYRFVFGASGSGKSYTLQNEVIRRSAAALDHFACAQGTDGLAQAGDHLPQDGDTSSAQGQEPRRLVSYLYIVPDQYTMQTQRDMVLASAEHGILNVDVLSFSRLQHRIYEELGTPTSSPLDDVGKSLILRRVASGLAEELTVLGARLGRLGMISEVKSMISEFLQYDLDVAAVRELSAYAQGAGQGALAARLSDLARIYEAFLAYEGDRYRTNEETLDILASRIPESDWIAHSVIVFDGFTGFTPVQYRVIKALMATAQEVTFALTLGDDGGPGATEILDKEIPIDPQDLFYLTRHTARSIMQVAREIGVEHGEDIDLTSRGTGAAYASDEAASTSGSGNVIGAEPSAPLPRFAHTPALAHFERALFRYPVARLDSAGNHIEIYQASTPEEEVRELCIRIRRLVREEGYAYRDCSIVCGDLAAYADALERMAVVYELPIYIDQTKAILRNPLTESISAVLEVTSGDYSYNTMFRYLRAGLSTLETEQIDALENYCLRKGIKTKRQWTTPFDEYEELRQTIMAELSPLLNLRGATADARTRALYGYLVGVHARERMLTLAERFEEQRDPGRRQEFEQIYRKIITLLDQIDELLGEEPISADDYLEILQTGFQELRLGIIPQEVDHIIAGDMERSRMPGCKVLFFLGANDGNVPRATSKGGLVSDLDREFLAQNEDYTLAPSPREQMMLQRLYLYMNLTRSSDRLVVSYAQTKADGSAVRPSYLVHTICQMYQGLAVSFPEGKDTPGAMADRLVGLADTRSYLARGLRQYADGLYDKDDSAQDIFLTVYGIQHRHDDELERLTDAAFRHYDEKAIGKATAEALYGRILSGSVTRLETAANCMLRHYLQYGLRLQEREERRMERSDVGSILHEAIQYFSEQLQRRGMDWNTFTPEEGLALADEAYTAVTTGYGEGLVSIDARTSSAADRMRRVLYRTIRVLQFQIRSGEFTPTLFEADFSGSSALRFDLGDRRAVSCRGRIDRVDLCERDGRLYIKIVDYKTGSKDIDLAQVALGLQLQLPLYLQAEMDVQQGLHPESTEIVPAAMLYYRFDDPILKDKDAKAAIGSWLAEVYGSAAEEGKAKSVAAEEALCMQLRPTGRVNDDPAVLRLLDKTMVKTSKVIPVGLKKDGTPDSYSKVLSAAEFEQCFADARAAICRLAGEILDGSIEAHPVYQSDHQHACKYCAYKEVCGFDRKLPGYEYNRIGKTGTGNRTGSTDAGSTANTGAAPAES